ncbi:hypothetical protein GS498_16635 [Rhodococcus hoagii]|nr:hypothetical protein [Prescottella equi]
MRLAINVTAVPVSAGGGTCIAIVVCTAGALTATGWGADVVSRSRNRK